MKLKLILLTFSLLFVLPVFAQTIPVPYKIVFDPVSDVRIDDKDKAGNQGLYVTVSFTIALESEPSTQQANSYKVLIEEDGQRVKEVDVPRPTPTDDLCAMLVIDTSGSMKDYGRMTQARVASELFLTKLPRATECGLILFDHEIRPPVIVPTVDRADLLRQIRLVQPRGGTAYLDALARAIEVLQSKRIAERAIVVLTDGIDLNSMANLEGVVAAARKTQTRIFTIGIGEPGKLTRVSTALVLDHSGSMQLPADDGDAVPKIEALHRAAAQFVNVMPSTGRVALLPFSDTFTVPRNFTNDKKGLVSAIKNLQASGETSLFDAIYTAVSMLDADGSIGKRAVVAMTDGVDNSSRRRVGEVIERAREAKIPLHLLGFGRQGELDEATMRRMADETGGKYYHAHNEKDLMEIFENLSIQLHDDGIDEATLTSLARQTGGQYYPAKNVEELRAIFERVTKSIQAKRYEEQFLSPRQVKDGTARSIAVKLVRRSGEVVSNTASGTFSVLSASGSEEVVSEKIAGYQTHGVVVAEMNHIVYLVLFVLLAGLIALPGVWSRRHASR